jgi:hypothetical protein
VPDVASAPAATDEPAPDADAVSDATFCAAYDAAVAGDATAGTDDAAIDLGDGITVRLGGAVPRTADVDCHDADAALAFTTAVVQAGALRFADVAGTLTADGLALTSGWLLRPDAWEELADVPARLRVTAPSGVAVRAPLADDAFAGLTGSFTLQDAPEWLPLPAGWRLTPGRTTLTFQSAQRALSLHSEATPVAAADATTTAPGPSVTFDGRVAFDGTASVAVDARRLVTLQGAGADAVTLSGQGQLAVDGGVTGSLALATDPANRPITLAGGLTITGAHARWDADGIALGGDLAVVTASGPLEGTVSGTFASTSQWKLTVTQKEAWELTPGVALSHIEGSIERRPAQEEPAADDPAPETEAADGDAGAKTRAAAEADADANAKPEADAQADADAPAPDVVIASIGATLEGWTPSASLSDVRVRGEISNRCADDEPGCRTDQVRLRLAIAGTASIPALGDPIAWDGAAVITLRTLALRFDAGARLPGIGPDWLHLHDVDVRLSNQGPRWCVPKGKAEAAQAAAAPAEPAAEDAAGDAADGFAASGLPAPKLTGEQGLALGFTGPGRAFGQDFTATGEFSSGGYCLAAGFDRFDPAGVPDGEDRAPLMRGAQLLYASRDVEIRPDAASTRTIGLAAGQVKLVAGFALPAERLPASLRDGLAGEGELTATLTRGADGAGFSFSGQVGYTLARPVYLVGSAADPSKSSLTLRGARLSVDYGAGTSLRIALAATGALNTPASAEVAASTTPLAVSASISLGKLSFGLSAAVDPSQTPDGVVRDAFGQRGLDVRSLQIAGTIGAEQSLALSADVTLPEAWARSLGIAGRVRAVLAANVAASSPCLEIALDGRDPTATAANAKPATPVLRLGPVTAVYARVAIAPTGCEIGAGPTTYRIDPGFALAFTGSVGATKVDLSAQLTKQPTGGFAVKASADVDAFDLGGARLDRTRIRLDLDTAAKRFAVELRGGLRVGDSSVTVDGTLNATPERLTGRLQGAGDLVLGGSSLGSARIAASVDAAQDGGSWKLRELSVDGSATILGLQTDLAFAYADGRVRSAAGALDFRGRVGPMELGAGGLFAFRPEGARLTGSTCRFRGDGAATIVPDGGAKQLHLRLCGSLRLGPLAKAFTWDEAFPKQIDFDVAVPRLEVGLYVARVYLEGGLNASLLLSPTAPRFWIRGGRAVAGGCVGIGWFSKCGNGVDVGFVPRTGRFEGTFIGIPVTWGSDEWRTV